MCVDETDSIISVFSFEQILSLYNYISAQMAELHAKGVNLLQIGLIPLLCMIDIKCNNFSHVADAERS